MHSHFKKEFYRRLDGSYKKARLCYISRKALAPVAQSPWRKLLFYGDDGAFITTTEFDFKTFCMDIKFRRGIGTEAERDHLPLRVALDWSYFRLGPEVLFGVGCLSVAASCHH
eukprot:9876892-Ditylum_brightwellii.AAC.1